MFLLPYAIMERIQVTIFFVQELILSGLYVWKARAFLNWRRSRNSRSKAHQSLRLMMIHLILSNIIVLARKLTRLSLSPLIREWILAWEYFKEYIVIFTTRLNVSSEVQCSILLVFLSFFSTEITKTNNVSTRPTVDVTILVLEYMGLYFLQVSYKAFVYAVKLKCEIGILNRLADFVKSAAHGGYGAAAAADNNNLLNDDQRRFQHFHSFQLSSQVEREWETTLRNTFGVALADEEKREVVVDVVDGHESGRDYGHDPLPSPGVALVAGGRASSSSGSSESTAAEGKRRRRRPGRTSVGEHGGRHSLLETFGGVSSGPGSSRNSVGSLDSVDGGDSGRRSLAVAGRRSSASSGLVDAADVLSVAGSSSSSSQRPRKGILRPQASPL